MLFANRGPRSLTADIASKPIEVSCPVCFTRFEVLFSELLSPVRVYRGTCPKCGVHTLTEVSTRSSSRTGEIYHVTKVEEVVQ